MSQKDKDSLRCSFCGKTQDEVRKLIAGPAAHICDECVRICDEIIADDEVAEVLLAPQQSLAQHVGTFACPKCNTTFALHTQHAEPPVRQPRPPKTTQG